MGVLLGRTVFLVDPSCFLILLGLTRFDLVIMGIYWV